MLTYAGVVWWPRINYSTVDMQLEHVQRLACLYITGAMTTSPTIALEMITGLPPLSAYIKQQAMLACFRSQVNAQWVSNTFGHSGIKNILTSIVPISHRRCDKIIPRYMFNKNYVVDNPKRSDWIGNNIDLYDDIVCYTDGSKLETTGSTGASVYDYTHDSKHTLPHTHTHRHIHTGTHTHTETMPQF